MDLFPRAENGNLLAIVRALRDYNGVIPLRGRTPTWSFINFAAPGADKGNRTPVSTLGRSRSATEPYPHDIYRAAINHSPTSTPWNSPAEQ